MKAAARRLLAARAKSLFLEGVPISLPHQAFDAAYEFASAIHDQVIQNDLVGAFRHFVDRGDTAWRLLAEGFPRMSSRDRAVLLSEVWTTTRTGVPDAIALPLFHAASALRRTLPEDLPPRLVLFRGVASETEGGARQGLSALSWTLQRGVAERYAHGHMDRRVRAGRGSGTPWIGHAEVDRVRALAWFNHRDEGEVVVDPSTLEQVTVEPHFD